MALMPVYLSVRYVGFAGAALRDTTILLFGLMPKTIILPPGAARLTCVALGLVATRFGVVSYPPMVFVPSNCVYVYRLKLPHTLVLATLSVRHSTMLYVEELDPLVVRSRGVVDMLSKRILFTVSVGSVPRVPLLETVPYIVSPPTPSGVTLRRLQVMGPVLT